MTAAAPDDGFDYGAHPPKLDLEFEGLPVDLHEFVLSGKPAVIADPKGRRTVVAFLVLGQVSDVSFHEKDHNLIRRQSVRMSRAVGVPFRKALELFDHFDKERNEAKGIRSLFDDLAKRSDIRIAVDGWEPQQFEWDEPAESTPSADAETEVDLPDLPDARPPADEEEPPASGVMHTFTTADGDPQPCTCWVGRDHDADEDEASPGK